MIWYRASRVLVVIIILIALTVEAGCSPGTAPATPPSSAPTVGADPWEDQSTVLKALVLAHVASEIPQTGPPIGQISYGTSDRTRRLIQLYSDGALARETLRESLRARFGDSGPRTFGIVSYRDNQGARMSPDDAMKSFESMGDPFPAVLRRAEIRIDGNTATIRYTGNPSTIHARRINGKWMIEFPDLGPAVDYELTFAPAYELANRQSREMAMEISAGKYSSAKEAFDAFENRAKEPRALHERLEPEALKFIHSSLPSTKPEE